VSFFQLRGRRKKEEKKTTNSLSKRTLPNTCRSFYHDGLKLWFTPEAQQFLKDLKKRDGSTPYMSYLDREVRILPTTGDLTVNKGFDERIHKRYFDCVTGNRHEKVSMIVPLLSMSPALSTYFAPEMLSHSPFFFSQLFPRCPSTPTSSPTSRAL